MGNIFEVNNEGVEALRELASRMNEIREEILGIAGNMQSEAEDDSGVLGPHADSLITVCEEVKKLTEDSSSPIEILSASCSNLATKYEEIIAYDPFSSSSDSTASGGTSSSGGSSGASGGSDRGRETGDHETAPETLGKGTQETIGEFAPASNPYDSDGWDTLKDVPFAGNNSESSMQTPSDVDSFLTDINGIKDTMSLSDKNSASVDMVGPYLSLPSSSEYERHHIPSKAALEEFGVDTDKWPCICLENEDHKLTDSYRGKQKRHSDSFLPDSPKSKSYKEETIDMIDRPSGFADLVRDEIYNIRKACGDKYDHSISQFIDILCEHIKKTGIPNR